VADLPLISWLTITRDRRAFIPGALANFTSQTYPGPTELIVLDNGADRVADLMPRDDPRVHYLTAPPGHYHLGELRNLTVTASRGALLTWGDDDDYFGPERLAVQYEALASVADRARTVCCFGGHVAVEVVPEGDRWIHECEWWCSSVMCWREAFAPLRPVDISETVYWLMQREVLVLDRPDLFRRRIHQTNVWAHRIQLKTPGYHRSAA